MAHVDVKNARIIVGIARKTQEPQASVKGLLIDLRGKTHRDRGIESVCFCERSFHHNPAKPLPARVLVQDDARDDDLAATMVIGAPQAQVTDQLSITHQKKVARLPIKTVDIGEQGLLFDDEDVVSQAKQIVELIPIELREIGPENFLRQAKFLERDFVV